MQGEEAGLVQWEGENVRVAQIKLTSVPLIFGHPCLRALQCALLEVARSTAFCSALRNLEVSV